MTTGAHLPRWTRRLGAEWERTVLGGLALVLIIVLTLRLVELGLGARGDSRQTHATDRFHGLFHPAAFAFLNPGAWQAPADSPFIPQVERPKLLVPGPVRGPNDGGAKPGPGPQSPVPPVPPAPAAITTVFYNGYLRTGTGAELAFMTVRRAGGRTPEILPVSAAAAGCRIVRFSPERLVISVGEREFEIAKGTQIELP